MIVISTGNASEDDGEDDYDDYDDDNDDDVVMIMTWQRGDGDDDNVGKKNPPITYSNR